eukprot:CAMPEP_0174822300 /NCGR_PEP_ID=MMETSP1107-20130205/14862_1 /TAXON_ID=36770 /ORGANISM="Paraphysomonas vestita, Strain GFlagA" /LENGTH=175 /DNA_ID=CAMNT_0016040857 /DNA_START=694 /DNA_END=1218 /DNA_ORIENTATION=-
MEIQEQEQDNQEEEYYEEEEEDDEEGEEEEIICCGSHSKKPSEINDLTPTSSISIETLPIPPIVEKVVEQNEKEEKEEKEEKLVDIEINISKIIEDAVDSMLLSYILSFTDSTDSSFSLNPFDQLPEPIQKFRSSLYHLCQTSNFESIKQTLQMIRDIFQRISSGNDPKFRTIKW